MLQKKNNGARLLALSLVLCLLLSLLAGCGKREEPLVDRLEEDFREQTQKPAEEEKPAPQKPAEGEKPAEEEAPPVTVTPLARPQLLNLSESGQTPTASVAPYGVSPDLSEVMNLEHMFLADEVKQKLAENLFVVRYKYANEFFEIYEDNRYFQIPNFVTVDSMMHTYHLYFSLLLNRTEKNYLAEDLQKLSEAMLQASVSQYERLQGTPWEEAALRNAAFFGTAAMLQGAEVSLPAPAAELAEAEVAAILEAGGIAESPLALEFVDYSQFKPRGYYEGDPILEAYFRAMMWYGQINFTQKNDSLNRSAVLMTMAMNGPAFADWERIYLVTSFFAGASDDLGYYDYVPALEAAYGVMPTPEELAENGKAYEDFTAIAARMDPPAINSIPVDDQVENVEEMKKGFRFMGQRFTIDAAIMQQLVFKHVEENDNQERRMLPDFLDVPAALGSDVALNLLERQGVTEQFPTYDAQMQKLREAVSRIPDSNWSTSLYSSWLYTLEPLLQPKGAGYPSFMNSTEWLKKDLETYAGSFTELKHDTVLYAKQMMAEMGGGPTEKVDDRGYVEPETEVYRRFMELARQTGQGLDQFGYISPEDLENLDRLAQLAEKLLVISEKELRNEVLTEEEYELIRGFGGTLEHFWAEAVRERNQSSYLDPKEIPSSLVVDIATDPNGSVLQVGNGQPSEILVVVPVDGTLRIASGAVYDFYQFEQPLSDRLTDSQWRQMIGQWMDDEGMYNYGSCPDKPWWTESYRVPRPQY